MHPLRLLLIFIASAGLDGLAAETKPAPWVHFVVGPSSHAPGTHEVAASARLMQYCVNQARREGMPAAVIHTGWPENPEQLAGARVIVFCGDQFPPVRFAESARIMEQVARLADVGCGFVAIHYAIGVNRPFADSASIRALLERLFGGFAYFIPVAEGGTVPRVMLSPISPTKTGHPVVRGVGPFSFVDEPYYKNRFAAKAPGSTFTALATAMVPPEAPAEEVVAWSLERAGGGRGVAIVMPHFFRNWQNDDLRRLVLNGIFWAAGLEVPEGGIHSALPPLETFEPEAVDYVPPARR
jgi:type 1 glutamine amidotransferase